MRKTILPLLLVCLTLWGCAAGTPAEETTTAPSLTAEIQPAAATGLYDPDSALEAQTGGVVRCYPLEGLNATSLMALGENFLIFSNSETSTRLTVLSGENGVPSASIELGFCLTPADYTLRRWDSGISFFDTQAMETVVLDQNLREVSRIAAPDDLSGLYGFPLLSSDRGTLYYSTETAIRALDLETGISRCLKETSSWKQICGLWMDDTVLECIIPNNGTWQTMFLSTQTGQILGTAEDGLTFYASQDRFYAAYPEGSVQISLFGTLDTEAQALTPLGDVTPQFLPEDNAAIASRFTDSGITLDYYDLDTGCRSASLALDTSYCPGDFVTMGDGQVAFLNYDESYGCTILCCWDTAASPSGDSSIYTSTHYTRENPDYDGLAACSLYAQELSSKYGIEILVYKEAVSVQPWDYDLEAEYLVPVLQQELEQLDQRLANYPDGFLTTLAGRFDGIRICIVRSLTGTAESGSLDTASGIQFWDGYTACIALSAGLDTEYSLYHELCHLIDTVVLTESGAYDRWDELNPRGFEYDYDYIANQSRDSSAYLQDSSRSFIDTYAMSFPKEDRARIMEYAMTPGNESYFQSTTMQSKLKLLCEGIREAFGLKKSPETFLWEHYLCVSLAYTE